MAKDGDKEALLKLIMYKKDDYYKLAYIYMKNEEDALDVLEDMVLILYENIYNLKNNEAFFSWSKTILVNCCKKNLKRNKKIISLENVTEDIREENDDIIHNSNVKIDLDERISKLNNKHQEVIKLRYFLDMDYESISKIVKVPIGTVKSRIYNGLKKLRESFGGENIE